MSTPIKDALNIKLAYKLGTPVSTAKEDAGPFSSELRDSYLVRAYGRLMRLIEAYVKNVIAIFPAMYKTILYTTGTIPKDAAGATAASVDAVVSAGLDLVQNGINTIEDIFLNKGTVVAPVWVRCSYIFPENYMSVKHATSSQYKASNVTGSEVYFYTVINGTVLFVVQAATGDTDPTITEIELFVKNDTSAINSGSRDIIVPAQYYDLLLTMAAQEAMHDQGDQMSLAKAQIYASDIQAQISILRDVKQMEISGNASDQLRQ